MRFLPYAALVMTVAALVVPCRGGDLAASSDFPNGCGKVESIDQTARLIKLIPAPHPGRGWECWWHVKITGITPGEMLQLDVGGGEWATPEQATFSIDAGKTWLHTAPGKASGKRILYTQKVEAAEAIFAWGPPFVPDDAAALAERIAKTLNGKDGVKAEAFELCQTREGRTTPAVRLTPSLPDGRKPRGLIVVARQHAWETGGSWVGKGFANWLISDDPGAAELRKSTIIVFVPIMDIDNVAIGAGGKNQDPHDHNRDWIDQPVFPAVAAMQQIILDLDKAGTLDLFVDLHNPARNDKQPFFFVAADELLPDQGKANLKRFMQIAVKRIDGPLPINKSTRSTGPKYDKAWQAISVNWVTTHTSPRALGVCLETSWNTPASTTDGYLAVGKQLGLTISEYLRAE